MDDHAPAAWRQVGSHVAVQEARDGHGRRSRHSVAAAMLAVAGAAAVLATLRVGTQGGQELAQLPPAKGRLDAIRVPGIRSAKQLLAEAAAAAKAKKQTLAVQIPGIRPQTQDIINSGAWDPKVRAGLRRRGAPMLPCSAQRVRHTDAACAPCACWPGRQSRTT